MKPVNCGFVTLTLNLTRLFALLALGVLAACGAAPSSDTGVSGVEVAGYGAMEDGGYSIPAVSPGFLWGDQVRTEIDYGGDEEPGSIVVDTFARKLYFVLPEGRAIRYSIAVGREGLSFRGTGYIGRKAEWPSWQPTANMVRTRPDLYLEYAGGLPGGLENPLGARALYLYRGGRDTLFRIHGTMDDASIGHATSAGCIRLFNQDVIDLYERVESGASVKVRGQEESQEIEGQFIDDAWGRVVPDTPENRAKIAEQLVTKPLELAELLLNKAQTRANQAKTALAEAEATGDTLAIPLAEAEFEAAKAAVDEAEEAVKEARLTVQANEKAHRERLAECRKLGIEPAECPPFDQPMGSEFAAVDRTSAAPRN